jgi:hypothetical protein
MADAPRLDVNQGLDRLCANSKQISTTNVLPTSRLEDTVDSFQYSRRDHTVSKILIAYKKVPNDALPCLVE